MKYRILALLAILPVTSFCQGSPTDLAIAFSSRPIEEQTIENLPKERADEIISELQRLGDLGALLRINHQPSIDNFIAKYRAVDGKGARYRQIMEKSASPYIFDELAPMLYKQEQIQMRRYGEGDFDIGESATTAVLFGTIIQRAPEFGADQKAWAVVNLSSQSPDPIHSARSWWELNKSALSQNQFSKASSPGRSEALQPSSQPETVALQTPSAAPTSSSKTVAAKPESNSSQPILEVSNDHESAKINQWPLLLVFVLAVGLFLLLAIRMKKR